MTDEDEEQVEEQEPEPEEVRVVTWPGAKPKQAAFLTALVFRGGHHGQAARAAKIARATHWNWLKTDQNYRDLHKDAMGQVTEILEDEALRRSIHGTERGIYYMGEKVATEKVPSDGLAMFMLRAADPEKYRERSEVKSEVKVQHKFEGTMEELLALYRKLAIKENAVE